MDLALGTAAYGTDRGPRFITHICIRIMSGTLQARQEATGCRTERSQPLGGLGTDLGVTACQGASEYRQKLVRFAAMDRPPGERTSGGDAHERAGIGERVAEQANRRLRWLDFSEAAGRGDARRHRSGLQRVEQIALE